MLRSSRWHRKLWRAARFELCEPRLFLSADNGPTVGLEYFIEDQAFAEMQPARIPGADLTGWAQARSEFGLTGEGQTVAIIDTGVAYTHAALDGAGAGRVVVGGYDLAENDRDPYDDGPWGGHGTHVAGIVASRDAAAWGVAPGVELVALRVFDDAGRGSFWAVEQALRWVHQHRNDFSSPITTVNLSLGTDWNGHSPPPWAMLEEELAQLAADGIVVTAAAGNGFTTYETPGLTYPAASPYVIPASSVDPDGRLSYFSQRHQRAIAAPGRAILGPVPDYLGNQNGSDDDWARYSGTSMAAPYLAGATVLVRQALQFAGTTEVTTQMIDQIIRSTADSVYDPITGATYKRLNLRAALESVMPEDDYPSTPDSAYPLGRLGSSLSVRGTIGRLADEDFFQFTAEASGQVTIEADVTHDLSPRWQVAPATADADRGREIRFSVTAGRTYVVGLGTAQGIGHYTLHLGLEASAEAGVDLAGGQQQMSGQRISAAGRSYQFVATREGIVTVEAFFSHADGDVDLQLFDGRGQLVGGSYSVSDYERMDVTASAGERFTLHAYTADGRVNDHVDLRITNLVTRCGDTVHVSGTRGDDRFSFVAGGATGEHQLTINDVSYQFDAGEVHRVVFFGGTGTDRAWLTGGADDNTVVARRGLVRLIGDGYRAEARRAERVQVAGGGGRDRGFLYDSPGDDVFRAAPGSGVLSGPGYEYRLSGVGQLHSIARSGGHDVAWLYDSPGNDRFVATPSWAKVFGSGFQNRVRYFDVVHGVASAGGFDVAKLYDSAGDDRFHSQGSSARMSTPRHMAEAEQFEVVTAWARAGGRDSAQLSVTEGDRLYQSDRHVALRGDGYLRRVNDFDQVEILLDGAPARTTWQDRLWQDNSPWAGRAAIPPEIIAAVAAQRHGGACGAEALHTEETRAADAALEQLAYWR